MQLPNITLRAANPFGVLRCGSGGSSGEMFCQAISFPTHNRPTAKYVVRRFAGVTTVELMSDYHKRMRTEQEQRKEAQRYRRGRGTYRSGLDG
ncbi:MAG: hypothetical protein M1305_06215 [Candidatus Marsarchaeota archaeon]|nr:hypothetical protein [Candidatus Marsarchaeota archaeon]